MGGSFDEIKRRYCAGCICFFSVANDYACLVRKVEAGRNFFLSNLSPYSKRRSTPGTRPFLPGFAVGDWMRSFNLTDELPTRE
jgi:hypothetical protein